MKPLKVIENPPAHNFGPLSFATVKAVVKVCSTCNGTIAGSINYGMSGEEQSVVLLPISVDVLDFIRLERIADADFRSKWLLLEWENKINIDVIRFRTCGELFLFLSDKMRLSRIGQNPIDSDYLAGNLYAKTIFGEEVLVNVCLESGTDRITGHLRLRSRSQGVAVSLGDRIQQLLKPFKH
jgi:coatomer subunit beta